MAEMFGMNAVAILKDQLEWFESKLAEAKAKEAVAARSAELSRKSRIELEESLVSLKYEIEHIKAYLKSEQPK